MGKRQWQEPMYLDPDKLEEIPQHLPREAQQFDPAQVVTVTDSNEASPTAVAKKSRWKRWLAVGVSLLLGSVVGSEIYRFISWTYELHSLAGITSSIIISALVIGLSVWTAQSLRGLRQLARTEALHRQALELAASNEHGNAQSFLKRLDRHYLNTPMNASFKDAIRQVDSAYNDAEIVRFVSDHALNEQDQAAQRCIRNYSVQSGILVALSPYASFDMLLVGWRNLKMLRQLAAIYGIAPGAVTQWQLLRQVLHNIAFSGLSELIIDAGSQTLGTTLTSQISARAGQGVGAGLFTLRTGIQAIKLCRPLPLSKDTQKALGKLNQQIIQDVAKQASDRQPG